MMTCDSQSTTTQQHVVVAGEINIYSKVEITFYEEKFYSLHPSLGEHILIFSIHLESHFTLIIAFYIICIPFTFTFSKNASTKIADFLNFSIINQSRLLSFDRYTPRNSEYIFIYIRFFCRSIYLMHQIYSFTIQIIPTCGKIVKMTTKLNLYKEDQ